MSSLFSYFKSSCDCPKKHVTEHFNLNDKVIQKTITVAL